MWFCIIFETSTIIIYWKLCLRKIILWQDIGMESVKFIKIPFAEGHFYWCIINARIARALFLKTGETFIAVRQTQPKQHPRRAYLHSRPHELPLQMSLPTIHQPPQAHLRRGLRCQRPHVCTLSVILYHALARQEKFLQNHAQQWRLGVSGIPYKQILRGDDVPQGV